MWLFIPSESCHSALESECSTLESEQGLSISDSSLKLWVTASGTASQRQFSWHGWKNRPWSRRLFRTLSAISTSGGEDALIGLWLDSLASPGAARADRAGETTTDGYGTTSSKLSTKCDQDSSFSKTSQDSALATLKGEYWMTEQRSLFGETGLMPFCDRWPKEGSMRNGRIYLRKALERRTCGNECSSWPTARTTDVNSGRGAIQSGTTFYRPSRHFASGQKVGQANLSDVTETWPTPNATDGDKQSHAQRDGDRTLNSETTDWQTPSARDQEGSGFRSGQRSDEPKLAGQATTWATPSAHERTTTPRKVDHGVQLANQVDSWSTPSARDHKGPDLARKETAGASLAQQTECGSYSPQGQLVTIGRSSSQNRRTSRRRLNPAFTAWLMGWPWWWTRAGRINCAASEMESWRRALDWRLSTLCDGAD